MHEIVEQRCNMLFSYVLLHNSFLRVRFYFLKCIFKQIVLFEI